MNSHTKSRSIAKPHFKIKELEERWKNNDICIKDLIIERVLVPSYWFRGNYPVANWEWDAERAELAVSSAKSVNSDLSSNDNGDWIVGYQYLISPYRLEGGGGGFSSFFEFPRLPRSGEIFHQIWPEGLRLNDILNDIVFMRDEVEKVEQAYALEIGASAGSNLTHSSEVNSFLSVDGTDILRKSRSPLLSEHSQVAKTDPLKNKPDVPTPSLVAMPPSKQTRRNALTPPIERAQEKCKNPLDTSEVWAQLHLMAVEEQPPFLGAYKEGLRYTEKNADMYLTRDALGKRLLRQKRRV